MNKQAIRRGASVLLVLCLVLCMVGVPAFAEGETDSGTCGDLNWTLADGVLTISGTGEMENYEYDALAPWYSYREQITSVVIEDGVTSIGDCAFYECSSLISIDIPESVTSIGFSTFEECSSLTSITISASVTYIDGTAFYGCSNLQEITVASENTDYASRDGILYNGDMTTLIRCPAGKTGALEIPASVTAIGDYAFYGCDGPTEIAIPDGVRSIGYGAFRECGSLTSITIPDSVTSIGDSAFYWCTSLTSITIPAGVTSIGHGVFSWCSSLTSIAIPDGVTDIDNQAFLGCGSLTEIAVAPENTAYASQDGILYDKDMTTLIICPAGKDGIVEIPEVVTSIGEWAFYGCAVTSIDIPDSVTTIGDYAFLGCENLASVTLSENLTSIGLQVFSFCTSLTSIDIPDSVTTIGQFAFFYSYSLTDITIPDSVTSIGGGAFEDCTGLTSITLPDGLTSIEGSTFYGCSNLTSIVIPAGVTSIGKYAFYGCDGLADVYYGGSEEEWNAIELGERNEPLSSATIHYNSTGSERPIIVDGTDESYTQGSENAAVIHCSGALDDLRGVYVDGEVVDADNYDLKEGSTILIFKASYLETLSVGEHTVTLTYTTGTVGTTLTVLESASPNPGTTEPDTTEPEATEPETTEPETTEPETTEPETTEPETTEPETTEPETSNPETTEPTGTGESDNPKEGDSAILLLPAGLMLACALSLLCLNRKKRMH